MVRAIRAYALGFPFVLPIALYSTWVAARLSLGHWPRPSLDDPKHIGPWVDIPYVITRLLLIVGLPIFAVVVIALVYRAFRDESRRKNLLLTATASVLFMIAGISFLAWDPFGVGDWFMD